MRQIPTKNYLFLCLIIFATILVTFVLANFYQNRHRETSILYNYLSEVTLDDLDAYLTEHEISIIYIDDKYNLDDNKEEEKFKEKIIENNLNGQFVFLDSNNIDDQFISSFNTNYHYHFEESYPTIIVMNKNGVIKTYTELNIDEINFEDLKW